MASEIDGATCPRCKETGHREIWSNGDHVFNCYECGFSEGSVARLDENGRAVVDPATGENVRDTWNGGAGCYGYGRANAASFIAMIDEWDDEAVQKLIGELEADPSVTAACIRKWDEAAGKAYDFYGLKRKQDEG